MTTRFASFNGPSTLLSLDSPLVRDPQVKGFQDIRDYQIHEVTSGAITLAPPARQLLAMTGSGR